MEYEPIEEDHWSQCDVDVHEHPQLIGVAGLICIRIDHRDLRGIVSTMVKHNHVTAWDRAD